MHKTTARHRKPRAYRGRHRKLVIVRVVNITLDELIAQLWAHTETCARCDQYGLCAKGSELAMSVKRADGALDWEHAVAAA